MLRITLAASLALGLAVAPSAQQRTAAEDTDAPGAPLAPSPETVGLSFFDDQDQAIRLQTRRPEASASAAITTQAAERRSDGTVADSDDLSDAFADLIGARRIVWPNDGFMRALLALEVEVRGAASFTIEDYVAWGDYEPPTPPPLVEASMSSLDREGRRKLATQASGEAAAARGRT